MSYVRRTCHVLTLNTIQMKFRIKILKSQTLTATLTTMATLRKWQKKIKCQKEIDLKKKALPKTAIRKCGGQIEINVREKRLRRCPFLDGFCFFLFFFITTWSAFNVVTLDACSNVHSILSILIDFCWLKKVNVCYSMPQPHDGIVCCRQF